MENYKIWRLNSIVFIIITLIGFYRFIMQDKSYLVVLIPAFIGLISSIMWLIRQIQFIKAEARTQVDSAESVS